MFKEYHQQVYIFFFWWTYFSHYFSCTWCPRQITLPNLAEQLAQGQEGGRFGDIFHGIPTGNFLFTDILYNTEEAYSDLSVNLLNLLIKIWLNIWHWGVCDVYTLGFFLSFRNQLNSDFSKELFQTAKVKFSFCITSLHSNPFPGTYHYPIF